MKSWYDCNVSDYGSGDDDDDDDDEAVLAVFSCMFTKAFK